CQTSSFLLADHGAFPMLPPTKLGTGLPEQRGPASLPEKALTLCENHLSSYPAYRISVWSK
ncbi:MAG: hypothetical protein ACK5ZD_16755, partial [Hyphomonadaceae bacterium]